MTTPDPNGGTVSEDASSPPPLCAELLGETDEQTRALVKAYALGLASGEARARRSAERLEIFRLLGRAGGALNGIIIARRFLGEAPLPEAEKIADEIAAFLTLGKKGP